MIYDSKETLMDVEGRLFVEENNESVLKRYEMDFNGLEEGRRYLVIPEGIREISCSSFADYNSSDVVSFIQNRLVDPIQSREEWQKKLRGQRVIKITFPKEVGKSWFDKAEFMRKMELRVRFLRLHIPATMEKLKPFDLPDLLEEIVVSDKNKYFSSKDGVLYTKDMKTLVKYPGFRDTEPDFVVPNGVEIIESYAFKNACISTLTIPNTVREIRSDAFNDCMIEELVLPDNMEIIEEGVFVNCDIRKLILPVNLREIKSYSFRGTAGISEVIAQGDMPKLGDGIFAEGYFRSIEWWPWHIISKACFINSNIRKIRVPEGVDIIEDFAFAGCYKAKEIIIPESVSEIGKRSFDEGDTYSADVTIPKSLFKYVYRFPALSKINKMKKSDAWKNRSDKDFKEDKDVLKRQKDAMQKYIDSINILQTAQKINYKQQIQFISGLEFPQIKNIKDD